jgi:hypothetical protein
MREIHMSMQEKKAKGSIILATIFVESGYRNEE